MRLFGATRVFYWVLFYLVMYSKMVRWLWLLFWLRLIMCRRWPLGLPHLAVYGIARLFRNPVKSWRKHIPMPSLYELIICRFTPGLRTVSYSWCGLSKMPVWRFTLIVFWSGLAWTMLVFSLVYYIGIRSENWLHYYAWFAVPIALMLFFWQRRSLIRKVSHEEWC